ncbi:hypothetical protein ACLKA7_007577 [Drosophila subpalustris]
MSYTSSTALTCSVFVAELFCTVYCAVSHPKETFCCTLLDKLQAPGATGEGANGRTGQQAKPVAQTILPQTLTAMAMATATSTLAATRRWALEAPQRNGGKSRHRHRTLLKHQTRVLNGAGGGGGDGGGGGGGTCLHAASIGLMSPWPRV